MNQKGYLQLKDDLVENYDYEAVSKQVWEYFKTWYDCDY